MTTTERGLVWIAVIIIAWSAGAVLLGCGT